MGCHFNLGSTFYEILLEHSKCTALKYSSQTYSYAELSVLIDQQADDLIAHGIEQGDVIALGSDKTPLSYALMHAALRLGITYVNIDIESPLIRNISILDTCKPKYLFFDNDNYTDYIEELASRNGCKHVLLDSNKPSSSGHTRSEQQMERMQRVDGQTIAYIMFTSGSTGNPKGVAITHDNLTSFIHWGKDRFDITQSDNFANLSPLYFDNSVFDFYIAHFTGAAITPIKRQLLNSPYELSAYVDDLQCTIWFSVPTLLIYMMTMKAFSEKLFTDLRYFIFGGEGYPKSELIKLHQMYGHRTGLVNVYGPTECTCICSSHTIDNQDFEDMSILPTLGTINGNFDFKILSTSGDEAIEGELCLIGPNVSPGYFNDDQRTTDAFEVLNESKNYKKSMYHTGDLVRLDGDELHFLGRSDNQIKHMGYRIELEEIENAINANPDVRQAIASYHRSNDSFGKIIAHVATDLDEVSLREHLSDLLPAYMLPNKIFLMSSLPVNQNGKIDRKSLSDLMTDHV